MIFAFQTRLTMKLIISLLFICSLQSYSFAQQEITNEYIVNLESSRIEAFLEALPNAFRSSEQPRILSQDLDIILIKGEKELEQFLDKSEYVESWGYNHSITFRGEPNDEFFNRQWGLRRIEVSDVWDETTGGQFDGKHDIVIAVLDDGFDADHTDLVPNLYVNANEIPNNNIDDDNNGYIDDYQGLNISTGNDKHQDDDHGTAVAGIVGAKGDNGSNLSGIMWDVKMLLISEVNNQADLIASFQYIVDLRKKWNDTNGAEGAFIVATNYSAGIDEVWGDDPQFASWCEMYDVLGNEGILNAGATANKDIDVDEKGDMPTTCPSDYLVAVTNTTINDELAFNAAFGLTYIDLGAPGGTEFESMPVLELNDTIGNFNGTSSATPHVAGTIGLLYSLNCSQLIELSYNSPGEAAKLVKRAILSGVDGLGTLNGKTVSNGRLNAKGAMEKLEDSCGESAGVIDIKDIITGAISIDVIFNIDAAGVYFLDVVDAVGRKYYSVESEDLSAGLHTFEVNKERMIPGIYFFTIRNQRDVSTKSYVITN